MPQEINQIKQEMVGYKYKHYKLGKIYLVLDIAIHTEEQELIVVYKNINNEQIWCRPLSVFNEEIDNENHKRFEKIDNDIDWKEQQEQAIFKEFEDMGYLEQLKDDYEILLINEEKYSIIRITTFRRKEYSKFNNHSLSLPIDMKEHQLLHRLFELWGQFDE